MHHRNWNYDIFAATPSMNLGPPYAYLKVIAAPIFFVTTHTELGSYFSLLPIFEQGETAQKTEKKYSETVLSRAGVLAKKIAKKIFSLRG